MHKGQGRFVSVKIGAGASVFGSLLNCLFLLFTE